MKLLTKTSLHFITTFIIIFFAAGIAFFQLIRITIDKKADAELIHKIRSLRHSLTQDDISKYPIVDLNNEIKITPITWFKGIDYKMRDTFFYDTSVKTYFPYRILSENTHIGLNFFRITATKSMNENNDLIEKITLAFTISSILFLLSIYFLNRFFFKSVWGGFFDSLEKIKNYDLANLSHIELNSSPVLEFQELNNVISGMIDRIEKDYAGLKEFSADLTHEIQTPLAVIRSKAEMMLQSPDLTDELSASVRAINANAAKLFKLNKALILLTKIENRQFEERQMTEIDKTIEIHLSHFSELMSMKSIEIEKTIQPFRISAHPQLIDVLILNLLKNAFTHTAPGGKIRVFLTNGKFTVENSGSPLPIDGASLFERFVTAEPAKGSLGLGLAIVKKICEYYGYKAHYTHVEDMHRFEIEFTHLI
jgi:signal transduction histidine kinase